MTKRVSARGIIIDGDSIYAMFRRRIKEDGQVKEYYVMPGGGIEEGETLEENLKRELKEEFSVDIEALDYLGTDENDDAIAHYFVCRIIAGTPKLGGEELDKCCESNYYEVRKIRITDLDKIDIISKDIILKAYQKTK